MCVRCGTGRIAWCTDPDRHGDNLAVQPAWHRAEIVVDESWPEVVTVPSGADTRTENVTVDRRVYDCKNGYGVSCMRGRPGHYGSRAEGTWEVGVLHITRPGWPVMGNPEEMRDYLAWDDVQGWCGPTLIEEIVALVCALPAKKRTERAELDT